MTATLCEELALCEECRTRPEIEIGLGLCPHCYNPTRWPLNPDGSLPAHTIDRFDTLAAEFHATVHNTNRTPARRRAHLAALTTGMTRTHHIALTIAVASLH